MATAIDKRTARLEQENAELRRQLAEARAHQGATVDVLNAISNSAFDLDAVLHAVMESAVRLCGADFAALTMRDGDVFRYVAAHGTTDEVLALLRDHKIVPNRSTIAGRVVLEGQVVQIADCATDPEYQATRVAALAGSRTALGVPLLRDGAVIGTIALLRQRVEPYTPMQIELVQSFAAQAVIAMESVRLLSELQQRTAELSETLRYQTATSDVLKVISRSTFDLQLVLDTLVETVGRLCGADNGNLTLREGGVYRLAASTSAHREWHAWMLATGTVFAPGRETLTGRVALEGKVVHIADLVADPEYVLPEAITIGKMRTILGAPLLRDGEVVGTLNLSRQAVEPFTQQQIELVQTFADQAVIAIENTRLLAETRQALDRQTAIAETLTGINHQINEELRVARTLQQSILPAAFPSHDGYQGQALMRAAHMIGGDFYDVFRLDDDLLGVMVADVSGKGVPAALFMVLARTVIQELALRGLTPGACLAEANRQLIMRNPLSLFVTVIYGILDARTGLFTYCSGGHVMPYLLRASGQIEAVTARPSPLVGLLDRADYRDLTITLDPGDGLLLVTDGVAECFNRAGEAFGEERLLALLASAGSIAIDRLLETLMAELDRFADGTPASDDVTALVVRFLGCPTAGTVAQQERVSQKPRARGVRRTLLSASRRMDQD